MMRVACPVAVFILFIGAWQLVAGMGWVSPILLASPMETIRYLAGAVADGTLSEAAIVTLDRLAIGYCLGMLFGMGTGFLMNRVPAVRDSVGLLALGLQTLPSVCWVPPAILWFGQSEKAMHFVVVMGSMWSMAIATDHAIRSVPGIYVWAARVMGSRGTHTWRTVVLPASLPLLLAGAKQGWAFAWRSLMAAEIYVVILGRMGLGQLLHFGRELNAMDHVIGIMLLIVAVGLAFDRLLFAALEKHLRKTRGG